MKFTTEMMADLLRETEQEHAKVEKDLPSSHAWQDWYGAFMRWRMQGQSFTREDSAIFASAYVLNKWADGLVAAQAQSLNSRKAFIAASPILGPLTTATDLNPSAPATKDGVTIIDGAKEAGYTTLQGLAGIAGMFLVIVALIVLLTPPIL